MKRIVALAFAMAFGIGFQAIAAEKPQAPVIQKPGVVIQPVIPGKPKQGEYVILPVLN